MGAQAALLLLLAPPLWVLVGAWWLVAAARLVPAAAEYNPKSHRQPVCDKINVLMCCWQALLSPVCGRRIMQLKWMRGGSHQTTHSSIGGIMPYPLMHIYIVIAAR